MTSALPLQNTAASEVLGLRALPASNCCMYSHRVTHTDASYLLGTSQFDPSTPSTEGAFFWWSMLQSPIFHNVLPGDLTLLLDFNPLVISQKKRNFLTAPIKVEAFRVCWGGCCCVVLSYAPPPHQKSHLFQATQTIEAKIICLAKLSFQVAAFSLTTRNITLKRESLRNQRELDDSAYFHCFALIIVVVFSILDQTTTFHLGTYQRKKGSRLRHRLDCNPRGFSSSPAWCREAKDLIHSPHVLSKVYDNFCIRTTRVQKKKKESLFCSSLNGRASIPPFVAFPARANSPEPRSGWFWCVSMVQTHMGTPPGTRSILESSTTGGSRIHFFQPKTMGVNRAKCDPLRRELSRASFRVVLVCFNGPNTHGDTTEDAVHPWVLYNRGV